MSIWNNRLIAISNIASLTTGMVLIGISIFLPAFVQGVMGRTPMVAGFTLSMMSIGWPIASTTAGRLLLRMGPRKTAVTGGIILLLGSVFFVILDPEQGPVFPGAGSFLIGVGMGLASTTFIVSIQSAVDWRTRGAATASNMFMRMLGNTIGAAILGGLLNTFMSSYLRLNAGQGQFPLHLDVTNVLLDPEKSKTLSQSVLELLRTGLSQSLHRVYLGVFVLALISLCLVVFLPGEQAKPADSEV